MAIVTGPWSTLDNRDDIVELSDVQAPTNGVTGKDIAPVGSRFTDTVLGNLYINTGTLSSPVWTKFQEGTDSGITQLTGDITAGPGNGSQVATLPTVNGNVGSFTSANITVDAKGRITAAANGSSSSSVASVSLTAQVADISATTLFTPVATGLYQLCIYAVNTAGDGTDTAPTFSWLFTDDNGPSSAAYTAPWSGTAPGNGMFAAIGPTNVVAECVAGQPVQYSIIGGTYVTLTYSLYIKVEKL